MSSMSSLVNAKAFASIYFTSLPQDITINLRDNTCFRKYLEIKMSRDSISERGKCDVKSFNPNNKEFF